MSAPAAPSARVPAAGPITTADRTLMLALRAWADRGGSEARARLAPGWLARLDAARSGPHEPDPADAERARATLRHDHRASARPDPARVHPSWYVRALRTESRAVRGAVVAHAPGPIQQILGRDETDPVGTLAPDPDVVRWVLALWGERLIGDVDPRPDDPLVIVALTQLPPRGQFRLIQAIGQVKHAFAIRGHGHDSSIEPAASLTSLGRVRLGYFRRLIGVADPRLVPLAQKDLDGVADEPRRMHARLGLVTVGRLLAAAEPYRARWALQHIPYAVARQVRAGSTPGLSPRALLTWEGWVLEAAWARLQSEGRLPVAPTGSHSHGPSRAANGHGVAP